MAHTFKWPSKLPDVGGDAGGLALNWLEEGKD
jgi:hypothetical protein